MKYVLMMHAPKGPYQIFNWPKDAFRAHIQFMNDLNKDLKAAGEFVDGIGLTPPNQAKLVRAGSDGLPVTDGIFPESKEFLAGFWLLDVDSEERAIAVAARASTAPGQDGKPMNMSIEVRRLMDGPPDEL